MFIIYLESHFKSNEKFVNHETSIVHGVLRKWLHPWIMYQKHMVLVVKYQPPKIGIFSSVTVRVLVFPYE